MKTYNITDILPLYKSYEGVYIKPHSIDNPVFENLQEPYNTYTELDSSKTEALIDGELNDISTFIDNDDIDFVMRNIQYGEAAEKFLKDLMLKEYRNCEKVNAIEGYDFKVVTEGGEVQIEVKSLQSYCAPFHITINEIDHAMSYSESYYICFVILPSLNKGVRDIRFLRNPIKELGITISDRKYAGLESKCFIMPEKFLVKPISNFVKSLPNMI